ncbi:MAG: stage 0 sporulation family protein [Anaerolineae bacterium]|nr:stage 0 sporulation family protein [Anaerolineae bacterium]
MAVVVGVQFRFVSKICHFDPAGHTDLKPGDWVVVDTARGREVAQVVQPPHEIPDDAVGGSLKPVVRRATAWDMVQRDRYMHREEDALQKCRERVAAYGLPMKVIRTEYSFDGSRLIVYFASEQRVDFRALVRDLALLLHTRVEMRQIGVRDEAKMLGGLGKCGRPLCCASWLREFSPVSIKMAKLQDLPLSPSEISGVCGRLLCCLSYELDTYTEIREQLPKVGSEVTTPEGVGRVRQIHALKETVTVRLEDGSLVEVPAANIFPSSPPEPADATQRGAGTHRTHTNRKAEKERGHKSKRS